MTLHHTPFQALHLARLAALFQVDTTPAQRLSGADLDRWLDLAEDALFDSLVACCVDRGEGPSWRSQPAPCPI